MTTPYPHTSPHLFRPKAELENDLVLTVFEVTVAGLTQFYRATQPGHGPIAVPGGTVKAQELFVAAILDDDRARGKLKEALRMFDALASQKVARHN